MNKFDKKVIQYSEFIEDDSLKHDLYLLKVVTQGLAFLFTYLQKRFRNSF